MQKIEKESKKNRIFVSIVPLPLRAIEVVRGVTIIAFLLSSSTTATARITVKGFVPLLRRKASTASHHHFRPNRCCCTFPSIKPFTTNTETTRSPAPFLIGHHHHYTTTTTTTMTMTPSSTINARNTDSSSPRRQSLRLLASKQQEQQPPETATSSSNDAVNIDEDNGVPTGADTCLSDKRSTIQIKNNIDSTIEKKQGMGDSSNNDMMLLVEEFCNHHDSSYHHFTTQEAIEIRHALLTWYRDNRRKLPWRGDLPPYDGSTAGINNKSNGTTKSSQNEKATAGKTKKISQPNIASFFTSTTKKMKKSEDSTKKKQSQVKQEKEDDSNIPSSNTLPKVSGYGVWVSEIMLQQTRVEAVIPYWMKWMESFPTVEVLANATEDEVNSHWAGLGFYRRARLLHQGAQYVVTKLDGQLPQTPTGLLKLPGIGPYTANAIASIAFNECVPVVDGNVCRVLSRLKCIANNIKAPILKDKLGFVLTKQIVDAGLIVAETEEDHCAGEVNQALMELGATYCAPQGSGIDDRDPLKDYYMSTKLARAYHSLDVKQQKDAMIRSINSNDNGKKKYCALCQPDGIEFVLKGFQDQIASSINTTSDEAARIGHTIFPLDPPKGKKREEDLAVAVISNIKNRSDDDDNDGDILWLLVKRPSNGLLAGQWEFPSVCVATRDDKKKTGSPPGIQKRRKVMDVYLQDLFDEDFDNVISKITASAKTKDNNRISLDSTKPLEHIFSHIKHYMWVETCETDMDLKVLEWTATILPKDDTSSSSKKKKNSASTAEKKEVRWMTEKDMKDVGITSGVKKILKAVKDQQKTKCREKQQTKKKRSKRANTVPTTSPYFSSKKKKT